MKNVFRFPSLVSRWLPPGFLLLAFAVFFTAGIHAAAPGPRVQLNVDRTGPRGVEEQTRKAVLRDYGAAWAALGKALDQNRPDQLGDLWVGFARQQFLAAIAQQKSSGLRVRYLDNGHQLDAVFYSPEGSTLELHDTAQLQQELLDGDTVVQSQKGTAHFLVVMTPTADHWQVRILQSVP
jgi:hypothetical protein